MGSVLHFDPVRRAAGAVQAILPLRDHALQPEQGLPEQVRADLAALELASRRFPPAQRQGHKKVEPAPSLRRHERKEFLTVLLFYFSKQRGHG